MFIRLALKQIDDREHGAGTVFARPVSGASGRTFWPTSWSSEGSLRTKYVWYMFIMMTFSCAVMLVGKFENHRATTHILQAECTVKTSEIAKMGRCELCLHSPSEHCFEEPVYAAKLEVSFWSSSAGDNITGSTWYCKSTATKDPCQLQVAFLRGVRLLNGGPDLENRMPCSLAEVETYTKLFSIGSTHQCYYSSNFATEDEVFFAMPSPGMVQHLFLNKHLVDGILLASGSVIFLAFLLGCLSVEGSELSTLDFADWQ